MSRACGPPRTSGSSGDGAAVRPPRRRLCVPPRRRLCVPPRAGSTGRRSRTRARRGCTTRSPTATRCGSSISTRCRHCPGVSGSCCAFDARDHLGDPDASIRDNVDAFLAGHGVDRPQRVLMLANPRSFGHGFNPITVYWPYDATGRCTGVVAEVHNTYGGRHCYFLHPDVNGYAATEKELYVSPFFPVDGRYEMQFTEPREQLELDIVLRRDDRSVFRASLVAGAPRRVRSVIAAALRASGAELVGHRPDPRCRGSASGCVVCRSSPGRLRPRTRDRLPAGTKWPRHRRRDQWRSQQSRSSASTDRGRGAPCRRPRTSRCTPRSAGCCSRSVAHNLPVRIEMPDGTVLRLTPRPATRCCASTATRSSTGSAPTASSGSASRTWRATGTPRTSERRCGRSRRGSSRWCRRGCRSCAASTCAASRPTRRTRVHGARENIQRHYDLSNDLFSLFLDDSMTYSCALVRARRHARAGAGAQDRPHPRLGARRAGRPTARDRQRLGRAGDPGRSPWRIGDDPDALGASSSAWPGDGPTPPASPTGSTSAARLPRRARRVRRGGQRGDDRSRR